ncbi:MAG: TlpA disulfide reductase family protein [Erythrobacter sp.]
MTFPQAPELHIREWLNSDGAPTVQGLLGKVILIEAFQMLCPGCVSHGLPQAMRAAASFDPADVAVLGLHSVFEHHEAQGSRAALEAFLHEYRITFPVGIDQQSDHGKLPMTMHEYGLQGTPSIVLIDREGRIRKTKLGAENDMTLGAEIMALVGEQPASQLASDEEASPDGCSDGVCSA